MSQSELQMVTQQLEAVKGLNSKLTEALHLSRESVQELKEQVADGAVYIEELRKQGVRY